MLTATEIRNAQQNLIYLDQCFQLRQQLENIRATRTALEHELTQMRSQLDEQRRVLHQRWEELYERIRVEGKLDHIQDVLDTLKIIINELSNVRRGINIIEKDIAFYETRLAAIETELGDLTVRLSQYKQPTRDDYYSLLSEFRRNLLGWDELSASRVIVLPENLKNLVCPLSLQVFNSEHAVTMYNAITANQEAMQQWREFCVNKGFIPCLMQGENLVPTLGTVTRRELTAEENMRREMVVNELKMELGRLGIIVPGINFAAPAPSAAQNAALNADTDATAANAAQRISIMVPVPPPIEIPVPIATDATAGPSEIVVTDEAAPARYSLEQHCNEFFSRLAQRRIITIERAEQLSREIAEEFRYCYFEQIKGLNDADLQKIATVALARIKQYLEKHKSATTDELLLAVRTTKVTKDFQCRFSFETPVHSALSQTGLLTPRGQEVFANDPEDPATLQLAVHAPRDSSSHFRTNSRLFGNARLPRGLAATERTTLVQLMERFGLRIQPIPTPVVEPAAGAENVADAAARQPTPPPDGTAGGPTAQPSSGSV